MKIVQASGGGWTTAAPEQWPRLIFQKVTKSVHREYTESTRERPSVE